jgi:nucleotide-binding universal stress UspA family protein
MSYKTILVHADLSVHAPARIRYAAQLANAHDAHLIGAAMTGVSRFMYDETGLDIEHTVVASYVAQLEEQARQACDQFGTLAREALVRSFEQRLVNDDAEGALVLLSRYADLVVLSQSDPVHPVHGVASDLPEYLILNTARPVLLLPYSGHSGTLGGKAVVAWDGSLAAARALGNALPLLCQASEVLVAQFPTRAPGDMQTQAADMLAWLARHGVKARVQSQHTGLDAGDALLSLAADQQAGLIVMGGYGHSRFRELVLGGVTRTVLTSMTVPVLMAH